MTLHPTHPLPGVPAAVFVLLLALTAARLESQAVVTAEKTESLSAFVGLSRVAVSYNPDTDLGLTLGGLYTIHTRWRLDPSVELRGTLATGSNVSLDSGVVGFRLARPIARFRPYVNVLAGLGTITFHHPSLMYNGQFYRHDGSVVYQYGLGTEYLVTPHWAAQVEYQQQNWDLGPQPDVPFSPGIFTVGIVYHLPFRPYRRQ